MKGGRKAMSISELEAKVCTGGAGNADALTKLLDRFLADGSGADDDDEKSGTSDRLAALHALRRTFTVILQRGDLRKPVVVENEDDRKLLETYWKWMEENYSRFLKALVQDWVDGIEANTVQQVAGVRTVMHFVARDGLLEKANASRFGIDLYHSLLVQVICAENYEGVNGQVMRVLKEEYIDTYVDVRYNTLDFIHRASRQRLQGLDQGNDEEKGQQGNDPIVDEDVDEDDDRGKSPPLKCWNAYLMEELEMRKFCDRTLDLLRSMEGRVISNEEAKQAELQWAATQQDDKGKRMKRLEKLPKSKGHGQIFEKAWISFLQLPLNKSSYHKVLSILADKVLPFLNNPILLSDFLTDSYDIGGVTSLLSLNSLFILISEHGLDYPEFYEKLYRLLASELFYVKHRARFFELLDLFLSSTHLATYLVAAFAKKLCRLALRAPPSGAMYTIVTVHNLLKRHPACLALVHQGDDQSSKAKQVSKIDRAKHAALLIAKGPLPSKQGHADSHETMLKKNDPFLPHETDPSKCKAWESSLWEIEVLARHYAPSVSSLVNALFKEELRLTLETRKIEPPIPVLDFVSITYSTLFEQELKRKRRKDKLTSMADSKRTRTSSNANNVSVPLAFRNTKDETSAISSWSCLEL